GPTAELNELVVLALSRFHSSCKRSYTPEDLVAIQDPEHDPHNQYVTRAPDDRAQAEGFKMSCQTTEQRTGHSTNLSAENVRNHVGEDRIGSDHHERISPRPPTQHVSQAVEERQEQQGPAAGP